MELAELLESNKKIEQIQKIEQIRQKQIGMLLAIIYEYNSKLAEELSTQIDIPIYDPVAESPRL